MNGKLYIKKFIRDDGETLSFDAEEIYLSENNTLLVRSDPATTAVEFTEEDGGEMIRQRGATYSQPVSGLIVPKSTEYWALCVRLSRFFILNHTYKIVYIKRDGSMFSMNRAWINAGLQIVPVPYENYSTWTIEFRIGDNFWTEYAEDDQGKEIYSNSVELPLLTAGTGGEVWSDAIQQTLSGLGNYFAIDGTSISASINKLEVRGDTYQQTYSGKNLFNAASGPNINNLVSDVSFDENTYTLSVPSSSSTSSGNRFTGFYVTSLQEGTTYTISYLEYTGDIATDSRKIMVRSYDGSSATTLETLTSSKTQSFTVPVGSQRIEIFFYTTQGTTSTFSKIQLEEGSTATSFEPYVGGIPAPNPDYPQDVNVVTGSQIVGVMSKNLFNVDGDFTYGSTNNKTVSNGDGTLTTTANFGVARSAGQLLELKPNTEYVVSATMLSSTSNAAQERGTVQLLKNTGGTNAAISRIQFLQSADLPITGRMTFTTGEDATGYWLSFNAWAITSSEVSVEAVYGNIQVEEGSTATTYAPYQSQSYEVNLGKNLLKIKDSTVTVNGITYTPNADGSFSLSGTATANANIDVILPLSSSGFKAGEQYTLSTNNYSSGIEYFIFNCDADGTWRKTLASFSNSQPTSTVTLPDTVASYVNLSIRVPSGITINASGVKTMIEKGSTATSYAPYFTPIELCKIGDYQDYIYKSGDDWYVHKACGKYTFTGNETLGNASEGGSGYQGYYVGISYYSDILVQKDAPCLMEKFIQRAYAKPTSAVCFMINGSANIVWVVNDTVTMAMLKNILAGTDFYYPLATPTDTKITNTTLVAQLNALAGAQAYNGKTVYQTNSATIPTILSVELLQSVGGGETWDNVGAVWEEGVGGVQTINVETTQTTYPVWTVTGPCSNPTLQNDTTDTIASFDGMIASGQTLTVNFADNTAYLDSAPVAKYVSGYVSLAPGENVIGFNSDGGSTQTSTISWDNIIN